MKKIFFALIGCISALYAHAAQIANIEYVHKMIEHKWDITVPYNPTLSNVKSMANMKYLLTAIDVANEILNGEPTTDYGNGEFATLQVADTTATNQAVETLIEKEEKYKFFVTVDQNIQLDLTMEPASYFSFAISAAGTFYVDWGDGTEETIVKNNTDRVEYSHDYGTIDAVYTIKIGGRATMYRQDYSAITFYVEIPYSYGSVYSTMISQIDGSLGKIFRTLPDGSQPSFNSAFYYAYNLKNIPAKLFSGVFGAPIRWMFGGTFYNCSSLTSIPAGLFAGISGAPAESMFDYTFGECRGLTSIPENLFGNISGTAQNSMFLGTFSGCTSLTGPSARINGQYLYEIWPDATSDQVGGMYFDATRLSDYSNIPSNWK